MKLAYEAFDRSGRRMSDTIDASSAAEATAALQRQGLYVTRIASDGVLGSESTVSSVRRRVGAARRMRHLAVFMRQLHVVVSSGTPMVEALSALVRQSKEGPWRDAIADVRTRVEEGMSLSEAMAVHDEYFDAVCRSLVAAGESSGYLSEMLDRLATMTRKRLAVRKAVVGAMLYPALLMVVTLTVLVLLLLFVVPRFGQLFKTLDAPLPPTTKMLIAFSKALASYWWAVLAGVGAAAVGLRMWLVSPGGRRTMDSWILRLPRFGSIIKSFNTARIARVLGVLLEGRVPIQKALDLTTQSVRNTNYAALLGRAHEAVTRGEPISSAFGDDRLISPSVCETVRSGERSGQVGALLLNVADFLDEENEVTVRSLTSLLEPVVLLAMGLLVGFVALSMFMPLFDLTSMVRGGT